MVGQVTYPCKAASLTGDPDARELWHTYRTPIILAVFFALVTLRVYLHATDRPENLVAIPKLYQKEAKAPESETGASRTPLQKESRRKSPSPASDAR